jgi:hypothetical protein
MTGWAKMALRNRLVRFFRKPFPHKLAAIGVTLRHLIMVPSRAVLRRSGYDVVRLNRRRELTAKIATLTNNTVAYGLFSGLILSDELSWGDYLGSKLLGLYESELYKTLEDVILSSPDIVINVGCAEGFYALGLAKLIPNVKVFAYDIDSEARRICADGAKINGLDGILEIREDCTSAELRSLTEAASHPFVLIDCEGGERNLLLSIDHDYANTRMIIECHDFLDQNITTDLINKFTKTHNIELILQGGKNPFACEITKRWAESDLWSIVSEGRPERMHWLHLTPLNRIVRKRAGWAVQSSQSVGREMVRAVL